MPQIMTSLMSIIYCRNHLYSPGHWPNDVTLSPIAIKLLRISIGFTIIFLCLPVQEVIRRASIDLDVYSQNFLKYVLKVVLRIIRIEFFIRYSGLFFSRMFCEYQLKKQLLQERVTKLSWNFVNIYPCPDYKST